MKKLIVLLMLLVVVGCHESTRGIRHIVQEITYGAALMGYNYGSQGMPKELLVKKIEAIAVEAYGENAITYEEYLESIKEMK